MKEKIIIVFKSSWAVEDEFEGGTYTIEYENSEIDFKGENLLLTTHDGEYIKTEVHPLKTIKAFKQTKQIKMAVVKKTEKENGVTECLIDSSNILLSEYNKNKKTLKITFKSGIQYKYKDVLERDYVRFEVSESQGSVFNKTFRKYEFDKLGVVDAEPLKELIQENKND